jgi:CO/xanthine dehydrogenase FAD-binding subunit
MVKHVIPHSYREALELIKSNDFMVIAGGTDLMVQHRSGADLPPKFPKDIIYLANLKELNYITTDAKYIHIGSMTTLEQMANSPLIPTLFKQVILDIASPGIRHLATIAGNIGNASPAGDTLVYLYAVGAKIVLESVDEIRILEISQVITGPKITIIQPNEVIKEILIPINKHTVEKWVKVGTRKADAISKVSFVGLASYEDDTITSFSIALGAIYKTVLCSQEINQIMIGMRRNEIEKNSSQIISKFEPLIQPITDQRSTDRYRKQVSINLIKDFLKSLMKENPYGNS